MNVIKSCLVIFLVSVPDSPPCAKSLVPRLLVIPSLAGQTLATGNPRIARTATHTKEFTLDWFDVCWIRLCRVLRFRLCCNWTA